MAQLFNEFFGSVFGPKVITDIMFPSLKIFHLQDALITNADVKRRLEACDDSCSMGSDALPSFVMKHCSNILSPAICILFNSIVFSCFWPSEWKLSHVTPFYKSGASSDITNYRPISILPKFSLIFERILFDYIYRKAMKIIKPQQHGLMKCTVSQIINYLDLNNANLDNNLPCLSIYFDPQKAFDSVPHHLLCTLGLDFINLFISYFNDRHQCVKLKKIPIQRYRCYFWCPSV